MPHARYPLSPDGLVLPIVVGLTGAATAAAVAAGHIPPTVVVNALIDTGSDVTCIASRVVQQLGLSISLQTSTQSIAGSVPVTLYEASLSIPRRGGPGGPLLVLDHLVVMELTQPPAVADAILGLDVLRQMLLILDGPAGTFTLAD